MLTIRRLRPGDEQVLTLLADEDADFDIADREDPQDLEPLDDEAATRYLADPIVVHWAAFDGDETVGFLSCLVLPLRAKPGREVMLYEIGVRRPRRREGIGRGLLDTMTAWMRDERLDEVWLGADNPGAEAFYLACGFRRDHPSTFLSMTVTP